MKLVVLMVASKYIIHESLNEIPFGYSLTDRHSRRLLGALPFFLGPMVFLVFFLVFVFFVEVA